MRIIDQQALDALCATARNTPRKRKNLNLHQSDAALCHRLFNAIEPGSYIRPHRHLDPEKDETFILLRGSLGVIIFDESGKVVESALLRAAGGELAANIPHGAYHTALSLESGTVFFEAKAGPYTAITEAERAPWAPAEGAPGCTAYLQKMRSLF